MLDPIAQIVTKELVAKSYEDMGRPLAKLLGEDLADLYKTLRKVVRAPEIKSVVERYRDFLAEAASRVEASRFTAAPSQILGPVLEGIRFEEPGSPVDQAFSHLLSAAFDRERVGQAHPAFPSIIRVLADDEIAFVKALAESEIQLIHGYQGGNRYRPVSSEEMQASLPFLKYPQHARLYLDHLQSLGLLSNILISGQGRNVMTGPYAGMTDLHFDLSLSSLGKLLAETAFGAKSSGG